MADVATAELQGDRSLLIVEDDKAFLQRLARAMEGRGFAVTTAESVADGLLQVEQSPPAFAVVDMRLGDGNGLDVISALKQRRPQSCRLRACAGRSPLPQRMRFLVLSELIGEPFSMPS